ncbi:MAG: SusC/RagA family TonB-linked outer membrane protein, partial [Bacteroidales bacterium]|nr:SusC/RagA family TonB-linked outer membrane protein [Bacteroidales bacterium]
AGQVPATITLSDDTTFLDEVVVIGYGTVKKGDMTGSVSTVKADQLNKGAVSSPADMLQGKAAGVVVTAGDGAPGSGASIRIRGGSSLSANNNPLVIVDGLPISDGGISGVANALASINPNDIESFTVLKDASATAIYGSRASNGVIMITTKKGSGDSKIPHVDADFTVSLAQNAKYVDVMTADQLKQAIIDYKGQDSEAFKALGYRDAEGNQHFANTNWQKEIYQLGQTYDFNVAVSGSAKGGKSFKMPYRVSLGTYSQDGTLKTGYMRRQTLALNLNPQLLDNHLNINLNGKGMYMQNRFANTGAIGAAVQYDPTKPVVDEVNGLGPNKRAWWHYQDRNMFDSQAAFEGIGNYNAMCAQNPLALLYDKTDLSNAARFIGNAQFDYKVHGFEDLRFNLNLGIDYARSNGTVDVPAGAEQSLHSTAQSGSGSHTNYNQTRLDQTLEFYGAYNHDFDGGHHFDAMLGYSWQRFWYESYSETYKADGTSKDDASYYLSNPVTNRGVNYLVSFFGRLNYSYDGRYLITATLRGDGTSKFQNNKWGIFPSAAFSWNVKNEHFLKDVDAVSALTVRLSYGQTCQQDVSGDTIATYKYNTNASQYVFGNQFLYPITPLGYNADLKWETTTTYNAGVDLGFLNGRLTASVDFYKRYTTDLLNWTPVAAGANLTNYLAANIGSLENTGVEVELNAIAIETKDWSWTIGANVAWNKTLVTKLTADDERPDYYGVETGGISGGTGNTIQVHQTGYAPNSFFVYQQVYDKAGKPIEGLYVDRNNDGKIDQNDKYVYHKAAPDVTIGLNTQLSYKSWTLAVAAHSNLGNYVYNNIKSNGDLLTDLWTNNFINNRVNGAMETNFATNAQYFSDYYVQNASFFKLDKITLSKNFKLCEALGRDMNLSAFFTVQNVATISAYKGIDPEIFNGIDNNMYPRPRTYILGVKFNF